ncbi:UNC93-like protein MFSD11 [Anastrepha ludens]|uniref:UNC93-like protein MFSD11 n=1 Tax=Anastrepha ludens TaxID=28586 RepID=UPI0023B02F28|nr:UNC93-like protein MFSD11 [Anastrepha ludens]
MDSKLVNILLLSFAFFTIFFAFRSATSLQKKILQAANTKEHTFKNSGIISLAIFYCVFAATCWFVPHLVAVVGPRWALIFGTFTYLIFIVHYVQPFEWLLYALNVTLGVGSAITYIAQGNYIARNSDALTATRNSGIFITCQQGSNLISAILIFFEYANVETFEDTDHYIIISVLAVICLIGLMMVIFLRSPPNNQSIERSKNSCASVFIAIKLNILLLLERDMLLLTVIFIYSGVVQSFYSGTYGPAMVFTKELNAESGEAYFMGAICKACGGLLGALFFAILGNASVRWGRDLFIYLAGAFHLAAFILIYLDIPDASTFAATHASSVIKPPNLYLAITCTFLYGLGASFYTVHIYSMLACAFVAGSTPGFAIYKFFQCLACALAYLYSRHASLYIQMGILIGLLIAAVACFAFVERKRKERGVSEEPAN